MYRKLCKFLSIAMAACTLTLTAFGSGGSPCPDGEWDFKIFGGCCCSKGHSLAYCPNAVSQPGTTTGTCAEKGFNALGVKVK